MLLGVKNDLAENWVKFYNFVYGMIYNKLFNDCVYSIDIILCQL